MTARRRKRRRSIINVKKFAAIIAAAAAAVVVLVLLLHTGTVYTKQGSIDYETQQQAVVVRDEQVISAENYGTAEFVASEGERVAQGALVAEVYKLGYNEKVMSELVDVKTKIMQYQENNVLADVIDADLDAINSDITKKGEEISQIINGQSDKNLVTAEKELNQLLQDKEDYLKNKINADAQLTEYYDQETQLEERVNSWRQEVVAPAAGPVSFYFDGCEELINAQNIQQLTIQNINDILNGSTLGQTTSDGTVRPVYRLVNNYEWYLVMVSTTPVQEFAIGNQFQIAFDEYLDKQYVGNVVGVRQEESGYVYTVKITDDIGQLLSTRRTKAKIYTTFEGIMVPTSSIKTENGMTGIYVKDEYGSTFVEVNVLTEKDGQAIIEAANDYTLSEGMEIGA